MSVLLADGRLPGVIEAEAEFLVPGAFGTCGPNMAAMAESYGSQVYISTPTLYNRMRASNRCDANGVSQMWKIRDQIAADGYKFEYAGGSGWQSFAKAHLAAGAPVGLEPSHGQVLVDLISGKGMNATNLSYHFNLAVGYWAGGMNAKAGKSLPEGLWMADGDNGVLSGTGTAFVNGRWRVQNGRILQYYSLANLGASAPVYTLAVYPKVAIAPTFLTAPDPKYRGWKYDAAKNVLYPPSVDPLNAPASYFERGFARYVWAAILAGAWDPAQEPIGREFPAPWVEEANHVWGSGSIIFLRYGYLAWSQPKNVVYMPWSGQELREFRKRLGLAYQAA